MCSSDLLSCYDGQLKFVVYPRHPVKRLALPCLMTIGSMDCDGLAHRRLHFSVSPAFPTAHFICHDTPVGGVDPHPDVERPAHGNCGAEAMNTIPMTFFSHSLLSLPSSVLSRVHPSGQDGQDPLFARNPRVSGRSDTREAL